MSVLWSEQDLKNELGMFREVYSRFPIKNNRGGNLSIGLFYIWFCAKHVSPNYIIENGVWKGATTWIFEEACPGTKIIALDPNLKKREYISEEVEYTDLDFSEHEWQIDRDKALVFFDDHQNALIRLSQAAKFGFRYLLFDDNYPEYRGDRHLTLAACLTNRREEGYDIPSNAREFLRSVIKTYYVFPPIYSYGFPVTQEKSFINETPLFQDCSDPNDVLFRDMKSYRWTTFVELNNVHDIVVPNWSCAAKKLNFIKSYIKKISVRLEMI